MVGVGNLLLLRSSGGQCHRAGIATLIKIAVGIDGSVGKLFFRDIQICVVFIPDRAVT